mmetsp:Transcript_11303/g.1013  ORF Transcript_11303/g.1013 Transcript_11303/m.1013 type:complete len:101 (-) Transcript_11303:158-460(-)
MPLFTSMPFIYTDPFVLDIKDVKILNVVDFPAPLGPKSPNISPLSTPKLLFLIAKNPFSYFLYSYLIYTESWQFGLFTLFSSYLISSSKYLPSFSSSTLI